MNWQSLMDWLTQRRSFVTLGGETTNFTYLENYNVLSDCLIIETGGRIHRRKIKSVSRDYEIYLNATQNHGALDSLLENATNDKRYVYAIFLTFINPNFNGIRNPNFNIQNYIEGVHP